MTSISNIEVFYKVRKIKEISFFVNETLNIGQEQKNLVAEINLQLGYSIENNFVELLVLAMYKHPGEDQLPVTQIEVKNTFEVSNLARFFIDNGSYIKLPPFLIINLVGMSISHTRALLSQKLLGTVFQEEVLTIMNPEDVARHFYPYMFDLQNENQYVEQTESIK